ncbi:MAG: Hsp20/alpha crystallin family protein [Candidatus Binatia bacterium]
MNRKSVLPSVVGIPFHLPSVMRVRRRERSPPDELRLDNAYIMFIFAFENFSQEVMVLMAELTPGRSFGSLSSLRRDMDAFFDRVWEDFDRFFTGGKRGVSPRSWARDAYAPPIESYVDGNTFVIKADLPGMELKDIELAVEGNRLRLKGERKAIDEQRNGDYFHREVHYGAFHRLIPMPEGVKVDEVQARYHDGVLEITMPAPETLATKRVPIEIANAAPKQIAA